MDDTNFDDPAVARDWIDIAENKRAPSCDIYDTLNAWLANVSAQDILDIGCGQGIISSKIACPFKTYTGVEPSALLLNRANELYSNQKKKFIKGSVYELPFPSQSFDAVFSVLVWHLLSNLDRSLEELARVLTDKGHFLIITANPKSISQWTSLYSKFEIIDKQLIGESLCANSTFLRDCLYFHGKDEFLSLSRKHNLLITDISELRKPDPNKPSVLIAISGRKRES